MKHLIVDSYNVIHAWLELKHQLQAAGHSAARDLLLQKLRILHDMGDYRLTLVFDGKGKTLTIEEPEKGHLIGFVFTPSYFSADAIIERIVQNTPDPSRITVASRDQGLIQHITQFGAYGITPQELKQWVDDHKQTQDRILRKLKSL